MKSLHQYINEGFDEAQLSNIKVTYNVEPETIVFQVPSSYSESDFQIYLGDRFYKGLPGDESIGKKKFGKNFDNINDAYFEYKSYEVIKDTDECNYEWDSQYDQKLKEPELTYVKIDALKYYILFDTFVIKKSDNEDIHDVLSTIFKAAEYNDANQYPIQIIFDEDNLEYTE